MRPTRIAPLDLQFVPFGRIPKGLGYFVWMGQGFFIVTHSFTPRPLGTQDQAALLGHDAAIAIHITDSSVFDLPISSTAHKLAGRLDDVTHATRQTRLAEGQLPTVRIAREVARVGQVVLFNKATTLTLFTEPGIFERDDNGNSVTVIGLHKVHILWCSSRHLKGRFCSRFD